MSNQLKAAIRSVPDFPKPGVLFRDISPILGDPVLFADAVKLLQAPFAAADVTHVVGMEARGFWFGAALAERLRAGFVPARKQGKLPDPTISEEYALEYGTAVLEIDARTLAPDHRVVIHDDVIATGGTAAAAARLVRLTGAEVIGFSFFVELTELRGRDNLPDNIPFRSVVEL